MIRCILSKNKEEFNYQNGTLCVNYSLLKFFKLKIKYN